LPSIRDYWNVDSRFPEHKIVTFMTLLHFEQIKRFMHISDCTIPPLHWYSKLDLLTSHIQTISKSICILSSNVSIDEMIVRFAGQTCGTVRTNSAKFLKILKIDKKLDWDTLSGVVVDNGPVTMLTTIHEVTGDECRIERVRRQPREISTNVTKVRAVFGTASKKALPISRVIDDYNHHMGGVDIADQLRGYYGIQLPVRRTWMPLFYWLLDTSIINSYLIFKKNSENISQKGFRIQLVWDLISAGMEENNSTKKLNTQSQTEELAKNIDTHPSRKQYVTSKFELLLLRLSLEGHLPEWRKDKISCVWCKYLVKKKNEKASKNPPQSQ
ncbi:2702_t:CDS:2, partial [Cetraspora pellucida]